MKGNLSPWNITPEKFPIRARIENKLKFLLRYAILAPSGHNSQPWKFKIEKNIVEFWPDFSRTRQGADPDNRELYISLGCALANFEKAAEYFGFESEVDFLNEKTEEAVIRVECRNGVTNKDNRIIEAIGKRMTSRIDFENKQIEKEGLKKITAAGKEPRVKIAVIEEKNERAEIAELVKESVKLWYRNKKLVSELQKWTEDKEGLPIEALNLGDISNDLEYFWKEDNDKAELKAEKDRMLFANSPVLLVFSCEESSIEDWIRTGRAYERVALEATKMGILNGFCTTVTEIEEIRERLKNYLGDKNVPQFLIRIGYGKLGEHTPRRNLNETLVS